MTKFQINNVTVNYGVKFKIFIQKILFQRKNLTVSFGNYGLSLFLKKKLIWQLFRGMGV